MASCPSDFGEPISRKVGALALGTPIILAKGGSLTPQRTLAVLRTPFGREDKNELDDRANGIKSSARKPGAN